MLRDQSASELRMLCRWCPASRWHESVSGSLMELREPVAQMFKGETQVAKPRG